MFAQPSCPKLDKGNNFKPFPFGLPAILTLQIGSIKLQIDRLAQAIFFFQRSRKFRAVLFPFRTSKHWFQHTTIIGSGKKENIQQHSSGCHSKCTVYSSIWSHPDGFDYQFHGEHHQPGKSGFAVVVNLERITLSHGRLQDTSQLKGNDYQQSQFICTKEKAIVKIILERKKRVYFLNLESARWLTHLIFILG